MLPSGVQVMTKEMSLSKSCTVSYGSASTTVEVVPVFTTAKAAPSPTVRVFVPSESSTLVQV